MAMALSCRLESGRHRLQKMRLPQAMPPSTRPSWYSARRTTAALPSHATTLRFPQHLHVLLLSPPTPSSCSSCCSTSTHLLVRTGRQPADLRAAYPDTRFGPALRPGSESLRIVRRFYSAHSLLGGSTHTTSRGNASAASRRAVDTLRGRGCRSIFSSREPQRKQSRHEDDDMISSDTGTSFFRRSGGLFPASAARESLAGLATSAARLLPTVPSPSWSTTDPSAPTTTSATASGTSTLGMASLRASASSVSPDKVFARRLILYGTAVWIFSLGALFFMVPFFKLWCASAADSGKADRAFGHKTYTYINESERPDCANRVIKVNFNGTVATNLDWEFQPQQHALYVAVGETALAFFRAKNVGKEPVIGTSVYAIFPPEAGLYFNKIQCFCFDEQLVNPGEEVDLPILFYIDPEFATDSRVAKVEECELSYLFMPSESKVPTDYADLEEMRAFQREKYTVAPPPTSKKEVLPREILPEIKAQAMSLG